MVRPSLEKWITDEAKRRGCQLIGFTEVNAITRQEFIHDDLLIDGKPAKFIVILGMILDDPILDAWTQSPTWPKGKNYIDEVIARVATVIALKLTKRGYPSRTFRYGAAYLKHLSAHAGLGIIGRNNLLITPQYGPHIKLRGLLTTAPLMPSKGLIENFSPCTNCPAPCLEVCPSGAFQSPKNPLKNGTPQSGYNKTICREFSLANLKQIGPFTYLWCRACEEICPVGNENIGLID